MSDLDDWFLSLPEQRRKILAGDKWALAEAAWQAARAQPAPITSESGNQAAQGASAITSESVPLLTRDEIVSAWLAVEHIAHATQRQEAFARAIEQAVRAKLGIVGKEGGK